MLDRLPILQPLPRIIFGLVSSEGGTTFSQISRARTTSSPICMYLDTDRRISHEESMDTPRPNPAKGYVAASHRVCSHVHPLGNHERGSSAEIIAFAIPSLRPYSVTLIGAAGLVRIR